MFEREGRYLVAFTSRDRDPKERLRAVSEVGGKACGLSLLPSAWTPPFFAISSSAYQTWLSAHEHRRDDVLRAVAEEVFSKCNSDWLRGWDRGLMLRSSSVQETLAERGAYDTKEIPADFDASVIQSALHSIFDGFHCSQSHGSLAVVVQARVNTLSQGHASNEKRVSSTENRWSWEVEFVDEKQRKFNSQRAVPDETSALTPSSISRKGVSDCLKQIARWCTSLRQGRVHFEWGLSQTQVWVFQLDFEDDQPDPGCDPRTYLRGDDFKLSGLLQEGSILLPVDHTQRTGWKKVDNVDIFIRNRKDQFPRLYFITGDKLLRKDFDSQQLVREIESVTHGRAVCRTDCNSPAVPRLNLPRTDSVSSRAAVDFMFDKLKTSPLNAALPEQVCFILHRFIPACVAVWALAKPHQQIVIVDAIWGLPDGLQYLNHDTFEFDTKMGQASAEHIRYKPLFLQETATGEWKLIKVMRDATRYRCLSKGDLREVADQSLAIAKDAGRALQIMWFCDVEARLGVGRNVPWFMMNAEEREPTAKPEPISPGATEILIRGFQDIAAARKSAAVKCVLRLAPEAEFFRDDDFIKAVASLANEKQFPVLMTGSVLSHAFYTLERENVSVITDAPARTRTRQRQVFKKLVRDDIPKRIIEHGERAVTAQIPKSEARTALVAKLLEEAQELLAAQSPQDVTGELADLVEVVRSLCSATGTDWDDVQRAAERKRETRGSFEQNVVLMETSWPTLDTPLVDGEPPVIALKDLGQVTRNGHTSTISYPGVLAKGASGLVALSRGQKVKVAMSTAGIEISEVTPELDSEHRQLGLPFPDV